MPESPRPHRAVTFAASPAVLAPITLFSADASDAAIESIEAVGAGATGIDLMIPDARVALEYGLAVADTLADTSGLSIFIRSDVSLSPGPHRRICPAGHLSDPRRSSAPCVVDLGIDRLGLPPHANELASCWPSGQGTGSTTAFMISTLGFDSVDDSEVMALAALAVMRGAVAITSDRIRSVRRVVDTVAAVQDARGAA